MPKPTPAFSLDDLDALLAATQRLEADEDRDWFAVRDLVPSWCSSESGAQRKLRRLVQAGSVKPAGRRMLHGILDPGSRYSVPTYRLVQDSGE